MSPNKPETTSGQPEEFAATDELTASAFDEPSDDPPSDAASLERQVAELRAKLQESEERRLLAERQSEDLSDRFRKAQVQLRNENDEVRARLQRTFDQKIEAARGDLVLGLLDTLDNLQRAISAADASIEKNYEALRGGVKATAEMFEAQLKRLGLTKVPSEGEQFNPEIHEAVEMVIVKPENDNRVIAELRPGYKFGERLLRPAQVRVGRASES